MPYLSMRSSDMEVPFSELSLYNLRLQRYNISVISAVMYSFEAVAFLIIHE